MAMFKDRALQVKMVDAASLPGMHSAPVQREHLDSEQISQIAKDQVHNIAVAVGATLLTAFLASATKEVIVHTAKTKIK